METVDLSPPPRMVPLAEWMGMEPAQRSQAVGVVLEQMSDFRCRMRVMRFGTADTSLGRFFQELFCSLRMQVFPNLANFNSTHLLEKQTLFRP